jgi:hypothetical protein
VRTADAGDASVATRRIRQISVAPLAALRVRLALPCWRDGSPSVAGLFVPVCDWPPGRPVTLINNGDAIGSGSGTIGAAGIAGTTIVMTRVGLTVVEQPQIVAASGNEHSNVKKKRDRRVIRNTDAANRSGSAEQSSGTSPR